MIKLYYPLFKKKFFLINISFLILVYYQIYKNKNKSIKVCICTLGKNENRYIIEYIKHYEKYGIDKIYLYDNNNINGERFESKIIEYINKGLVELKNWRGLKAQQENILNDCYKKNNNKYDWIIFNDIDEFIYLKNYFNIKEFLKANHFNKCQIIYLNWLMHTDNNHMYYNNKSLFERFTEIYNKSNNDNEFRIYNSGKSIIRGNISNINLYHAHYLTDKLKICNSFGKRINMKYKKMDINNYYFNHFYCKSVEEFINKLKRGSASNGKKNYEIKIFRYFYYNKITDEKINYIERKIGLNILFFY